MTQQPQDIDGLIARLVQIATHRETYNPDGNEPQILNCWDEATGGCEKAAAALAALWDENKRLFGTNVAIREQQKEDFARAEQVEAEVKRLTEERDALIDALGRIARKNDLRDVPAEFLEAAARNGLYECELIARSAIESLDEHSHSGSGGE